MCFVGTDRKFSISFWWETVWLLNFALSWHVSKRLGSSATPSSCLSGLEEAWQAWHPCSLLQSGTRTEDHCPGTTSKLSLQRCSSDSPYSWLFHHIQLFHTAAFVPCSSVEVVSPGTDRRRWKPTWEPCSEKQRTCTLAWLRNTATLLQKLYF